MQTCRALLVWLVMLGLAVANGALRVAVLEPRLGPRAGHVVSTLVLSIGLAAVCWAFIRWVHAGSPRQALSVGLLWVALTVAFEFGFGRLVANQPWSELLADYNLLAGRIWLLALLVIATAPFLAAKLRGLF